MLHLLHLRLKPLLHPLPRGAEAPAAPAAPAGGREVYYLNFKPEVAEIYAKIAEAYKAETGVTLKVVTAASGTYEQTLKSEIAKAMHPFCSRSMVLSVTQPGKITPPI